jgi:hypothetical protein
VSQNIIINGVIYNGVDSLEIPKNGGGIAVFNDLTGDTVTPETLAEGVTAHDASGEAIVGTMSAGGVEIDPDTIIEKTATGVGIVTLNDVSEIAHKVEVTVTGNAGEEIALSVTGDNLFGGEALANRMVAVGATRDESNKTITFNPASSYSPSNQNWVIFDKFKENTQYTIIMYGRNNNANAIRSNLRITYTDGIQALSFSEANTNSYLIFTTPAGKTVSALHTEWYGGTTTLFYDCCGIFEGVITEAQFPEYVGVDYTVLSGDTVLVDSFYPNMNFIADASLSVNYHRSYGMEREYNLFWDIKQNNGNPANYEYSFYNFPVALFKPKYDFVCSENSYYSANCTFRAFIGTDIIKDFDARRMKSGQLMYTFYLAPNLENARTIKVHENITYLNPFGYTPNLKEVRFEGVIGQDGLSFAQSTLLSKASIESVINALSSTTTGLTVTFSLAAVNSAFATTEGGTDGSTSAEWSTLVATKSNWTISLA